MCPTPHQHGQRTLLHLSRGLRLFHLPGRRLSPGAWETAASGPLLQRLQRWPPTSSRWPHRCRVDCHQQCPRVQSSLVRLQELELELQHGVCEGAIEGVPSEYPALLRSASSSSDNHRNHHRRGRWNDGLGQSLTWHPCYAICSTSNPPSGSVPLRHCPCCWRSWATTMGWEWNIRLPRATPWDCLRQRRALPQVCSLGNSWCSSSCKRWRNRGPLFQNR